MPSWDDGRPILVAAYGLMDKTPRGDTSGAAIAAAIGVATDDNIALWKTLRALHDADYLVCHLGAYGELPITVDGTEKGPVSACSMRRTSA